jgi:hypothetical protein
MVPVTHYSMGIEYQVGDFGWRVAAGCGLILRGTGRHSMSDRDSMDLDEVDCPKCREIYALEFLAEVP